MPAHKRDVFASYHWQEDGGERRHGHGNGLYTIEGHLDWRELMSVTKRIDAYLTGAIGVGHPISAVVLNFALLEQQPDAEQQPRTPAQLRQRWPREEN